MLQVSNTVIASTAVRAVLASYTGGHIAVGKVSGNAPRSATCRVLTNTGDDQISRVMHIFSIKHGFSPALSPLLPLRYPVSLVLLRELSGSAKNK